MPIPPPEKRTVVGLLRSRECAELIAKLGGPVGTAFAFARTIVATSGAKGFWSIGVIVGTAVTGGFAYRSWHLEQISKRRLRRHDVSRGVLETLHAALVATSKSPADAGPRVCFYVPEQENRDLPAEHLAQVTPYMGGDEKSYRYGRRIPSNMGVVGRCYRTGGMLIAKLPANRELVDFLVRDFGFSRQEAEEVASDRKAWAAIPIGDAEIGVYGVIFADFSSRDFFGTRPGSLQEKILVATSVAAARFCKFWYDPDRKGRS